MRQYTDSYILFSPIKYWKTGHLVSKRKREGFLFNRKHFHATNSAIACILWENINDNSDIITLHAFDIDDFEEISFIEDINIRKVYKNVSQYFFDKREFTDDTQDGVWSHSDGYEGVRLKSTATKNIYNKNVIAYMYLVGFSFDFKHKNLTRCTLNLRKNGFLVRKDNYLHKLPLWVAKMYDQDCWYHTYIYSTSADGGSKYELDSNLIKNCLLYTCLAYHNKCISFNGSDGRYYRNELCFDTTNGDTVASRDLSEMKLDSEEQELINTWKNVITEAKKTANYNNALTYGVYQITKELNTFHKEGTGKSEIIIYDYPTLNSHLITLKNKLKLYYRSHITNKMFKYELLK